MSLSEPAVHAPPSTGDWAGVRLRELLDHVIAVGGSDLHLTAGVPPTVRLHGELVPVGGWEQLTSADTEALVRAVLVEDQWADFAVGQELDLAYSIPGLSRFRVNVYRQRGSVGAAFRTIPQQIRPLDELGLPDSVEAFSQLPRGLVLVTGPTGSGKSTTMASLLDVANRTRTGHIVTIEDPIEYLHSHGRCIVNQREVGVDTAGFAVALRQVLRQDPDIIMIGELRDLETTSVAMTAAETGHLVLATMHTQSAAQTIERMVDIYPPHQQHQIRSQLAGCLQGVVTQELAPLRTGSGRTVVCEVMVVSSAIRTLIREAKTHQITSAIQSASELGMVTFDQHLAQRYAEQLITQRTALDLAHDPAEFRRTTRM